MTLMMGRCLIGKNQDTTQMNKENNSKNTSML